MPVEESAIQLIRVPEHWPEPGRALPPRPAAETAGDLRATAAEQGPALPRQFAVLLTEVLAGVRPVRQVAPWLSKRGSLHLSRLMPLFKSEQQPRVLRVLTTRPAPDVVEMTVVATVGPRPRALAIRLEHNAQSERWQCTDIESALPEAPGRKAWPEAGVSPWRQLDDSMLKASALTQREAEMQGLSASVMLRRCACGSSSSVI